MSFSTAPLPEGPTCVMAPLMAARAGRTRSRSSAAPPTRNDSAPLSACTLLPVTGASRKEMPRARAAAASSRTQPTVSVLDSMATASRGSAPSAPAAPSHTARDASSSASIASATSASRTASAGVAAARAPASTRGAARAGLRFQTRTSNPLRTSSRAMPEPMIPNPSTAIFDTMPRR